jgi:ParB-like chromosome segregation protein Spo0J
MNPATEIIGDYPVHPIASLFPLLEGEDYERLKVSIQNEGQLEPIITTLPSLPDFPGGQLLDGRNRLRICIELAIKPIIRAYMGPVSYEDYVLAQNLYRRHLTADQRMMIATEAMRLNERAAAEARKQEAGKKHGRGRDKLPPKSGEAISNRHADETASKIAAAAKGTRYQAEQALAVAEHAPEMVEEVKNGKKRLKDAARVAQERKAAKGPQQRRPEPNYLDAKTKLIGHAHDVLKKYPQKRVETSAAITQVLQPGEKAATEFIRSTYKEFTRLRREADLAPKNRPWNNDHILKMDLVRVLYWVENEFRAYIDGLPAKAETEMDAS